jgi:hypothetical protein
MWLYYSLSLINLSFLVIGFVVDYRRLVEAAFNGFYDGGILLIGLDALVFEVDFVIIMTLPLRQYSLLIRWHLLTQHILQISNI